MARSPNSKKSLLSGPPTQSAAARSSREDTTRGINLSLARDILRRAHRHIDPAGGCMTYVPHPALGDRKAVLVGIVLEHRFAFHYWIKCKQDLRWDRHGRDWISDRDFIPPDLVTMDWHDDIGGNCDLIESEVRRLNQSNEAEVGLFCWAGLRSINDGHVFPAVWLNAIGNVYAIIKQRDTSCHNHYTVKDRYGKEHAIRYCRTPAQFLKARRDCDNPPGLIWDIDLDYFTRTTGNPDERYMPALSGPAIVDLLDADQDWVREILWNLEAITIALEPEYTGGLTTSLHLFRQWENVFFAKPLFTRHCSWRAVLS